MTKDRAVDEFIAWNKTCAVHEEIPRQQAYVAGFEKAIELARQDKRAALSFLAWSIPGEIAIRALDRKFLEGLIDEVIKRESVGA